MAPVTFTEKEHEALAERVAPLMLMEVLPAVAVMVWSEIVPDEHEGEVSPLGSATTSPTGSVSEKLTPVIELAFVLVNVKVRVLLVPWPIVVGEKALESVGLVGRGHPVITILSMRADEAAFDAPPILIRNVVVLRPVDDAVQLPVAGIGSHLPF